MSLPDLCKSLTDVLTAQIEGMKALITLLQQEREVLIDLDAKAVDELTKRKDTLLLKLRLLDEERIRLVTKAGHGRITLQEFSEKLSCPELTEIRSKLLSLVQTTDELNAFNRVLMERSLSYLNNGADFIRGRKPSAITGKGSLISLET